MENRREFLRVHTERACKLKISISGSTEMQEIPARMVDISTGGCKLLTEQSLGEVKVLYLDIIFDEKREAEIRESNVFLQVDMDKALQNLTKTLVIKLIRESEENNLYAYNTQFINLSADLEREVFSYVNRRNMLIRRSKQH